LKLDTIVQDDWVEHGSPFFPSSSASTLDCSFASEWGRHVGTLDGQELKDLVQEDGLSSSPVQTPKSLREPQ
jgi:hypothetical protein